MQIEDCLYHKGMHLPLLGENPTDMKDEEWALLNRPSAWSYPIYVILQYHFQHSKGEYHNGSYGNSL